MKIDFLDTDQKVVVVAEIGNNHEGDCDVAEKMIRTAAGCGVDAVKFQTFRTENYVSKDDIVRYDRLKSFELSYDGFRRLKRVADSEGVVFLSTPFDLESAHFLNEIVPAFKISSGDNTFLPLIELIAGFGKPIILSSGLSGLNDLKMIKGFIESVCINPTSKLAILQCVSSYPTPVGEVNLAVIPTLRRELECTVGYSDHTLGIDAAVYSICFGARIVEKHFTLDKQYSDFRDHQLSADPEEMKHLVERIRSCEMMMGDDIKKVEKSEQCAQKNLRRSIIAKRTLSVETTISLDDICWVRPAGGYKPGNEYLIVGKKVKREIKKGEMIRPEHITE